jgi:hypothetical protein
MVEHGVQKIGTSCAISSKIFVIGRFTETKYFSWWFRPKYFINDITIVRQENSILQFRFILKRPIENPFWVIDNQ